MRTLILLRGLPGSGKTTLANNIVNEYSVCEADKFWIDEFGNYKWDGDRLGEAHEWCQKEVEIRMLDNKVNPQFYPEIVVSNTFTTEKELEPYINLARKYDYKVVSLIVENRHGGRSIHNVPDEVIRKMEKRFEIKL